MFRFKSFFLVLVAVVLEAPVQNTFAQQKKYFGTMDVKVRVFRFLVTVDKQGKGTLRSLDEGNREFPLEEVTLDDGRLEFKLKVTKAEYASKRDKASKSYRGKWKQSGNEFDLEFNEVDSVPEDPTREIWEGEMAVFGRKMTLRFRLYDSKDHPILMDSPDQRVGGFTGSVEEKDGKVIYRIPALKGEFEGQLSDDKQTLKGTWKQGLSLPLTLKKVTAKEMKKDAAAPNRPQTPKAPFPYEISDVTIKNKEADLTLAATLTVPKKGNQFPCAILISGSGAQDRDESLMDHKPFWVLADHLSRNGIACLRFDDRGTAKSTGDHSVATSKDFASDVSAIVDFLKTQTKIDPGKIGLCGHSEGGLIAPLVAADRDDIAFIVMMAGPGVTGEEILKNQIRLILKASGAKDEEIDAASMMQGNLLEMAISGAEFDEQKIAKMIDQLIEKFPSQDKDKKEILTNAKAGFKRLSTPWMKYFLTYDPASTLAKIKCPVLVLNGSKDTQVDPELNLPAIRKAFESSSKKNFKVVLLPDLNHLFQKCKTGAPDEYQSIEETFSPTALSHISDWILEQATK